MTIHQGIAGSASHGSDSIDVRGCSACPVSSGRFFLIETEDEIQDQEDARAIVLSDAPRQMIDFDESYEREVGAGTYLACTEENVADRPTCVPIVVEQDQVTTVHVVSGMAGAGLVIIRADGEREDRVYVLTDAYSKIPSE